MGTSEIVVIVVIVAIFVIAIAFTGLILLFVFKLLRSVGIVGPRIKGPALTGTARVLSVKSNWSYSERSFLPQGNISKIALRVQVPDREPYDVTVTQRIALTATAAIQPGSVVPVLIDSTNPQTVRIDFSQPIMPMGAGSSNVEVLDLRQGVPGGGAAIANQIRAALAGRLQAGSGGVQFDAASAADLLASGQRVQGVLKSFADTGNTPRSLGQVPSSPEIMDDPLYVFDVALQFPNLPPIDGQAVQRVPRTHVPNLAIGLPLVCAVDHANPGNFVVDWGHTAH